MPPSWEARKPTERRTHEEIEQLPENQRQQTDPDASFTKKGGKSYFGYKAHANVDAEHKVVRKLEVTTAKDGDITVMDKVMDHHNTKKTLWADSAYKSKDVDQKLAEKAITHRINRRAYRNHPLNGHDERFNRTSSRTQSQVEHVFGAVKLWGRKVQVRSIGLSRATLGMSLKFMTYNMNRLRFLQEKAAREMAC